MAAAANCGRCGSPNQPNAVSCARCGSPLRAGAAAQPSYSYTPQQQVAAAVPHKTRHSGLWIAISASVIGLMLLMGAVALLVGQAPSGTGCVAPCQPAPPQAPPLSAPHTYTSSQYGYSIQYYDAPPGLTQMQANKLIQPTVMDGKSIGWTIANSWPYGFTAEPASGRTAEQVVHALQQSRFPSATLAYSIPGAALGYNPGYGNIYDLNIRPVNGQAVHARVILVVAVKKDLAVEMIAVGPYVGKQPKGLTPSPADTPITSLIDYLINTVTFPGDPTL